MTLAIVSCGVGPEDLTSHHQATVASADLLAGGQRLLDWFPEFKGEKIVLGTRARDTVASLASASRNQRVVVLASGDALFFGIGRLFAQCMAPEHLEIIPNITAAQAALARLKIAWEKTRFYSVHGRKAPLPWRTILQTDPAVIYTDPQRTPAAIAADLTGRWPAASTRRASVLANLGGPAEQCTTGRLADMATLSTRGLAMLVIHGDDATSTPPLPLGLADDQYERENGLITHPELRAVVLAKLRLGTGVMWDLGAGSGSVGVEAAGLCDGLTVYAVEKNSDRCVHIANNAARAGCAAVHVVNGPLPEALIELPPPRSVFVGGGGADINTIVETAFARMLPGGSLVVSAIMLETRARLLACLPAHRIDILELEVRRARKLGPGYRMEPGNPVTLFLYRKEHA